MDYFDYCTGLTMTNERFDALVRRPARDARQNRLTQRHMDLAASIQAVTEEIDAAADARHWRAKTGCKNLCLAGGVALNCVANGKILRDGTFENIWIQPAAGDAGGALGAALAAYHHATRTSRGSRRTSRCACRALISGRHLTQAEIEQRLTAAGGACSPS